jgi:hypothetical protein
MLFVDRRRRGCGKCGKAEAFFAEAFPSSGWKSSRRSRRRPPFWISPAAAFSTAFRGGSGVGLADEETNIGNGKDTSKIRSRIQTPARRANRSGSAEHGSGRARLSTRAQRAGTLAGTVPQQRVDRFAIDARTAVGSGKREAQGQDWRYGDADGALKKMQSWVQQRRNADTSIITAKNWDQFRKPAK